MWRSPFAVFSPRLTPAILPAYLYDNSARVNRRHPGGLSLAISSRPIDIGIAGCGTIARAQHVPALLANPAFRLVGGADPANALPGLPAFASLDALIAAFPDLDAISVCTPPQWRHGVALAALRAGLHVLLEKPPATSPAELDELDRVAHSTGRTLFTAWHSCHAACVAPARDWLHPRRVARISVLWREDVRAWHPGQQWIWQTGGMGVFDAGINAISILCAILPGDWAVERAMLDVPRGRAAPIAAELALRGPGGVPVAAQFDWRESGTQLWQIRVETREGNVLLLQEGGRRLSADGAEISLPDSNEYDAVYQEFSRLIGEGGSFVQALPLRLVTEALAQGSWREAEAFADA